MYYLLSLFIGILISLMVAFNGGLAKLAGVYSASVIIHVLSLVFVSAWILLKRDRPFNKAHPWFFYLGGILGVVPTILNGFAFGRISIPAILALGLFGQSVLGLFIDKFGLMGMPKYPFRKRKLIGLAFVFCGIVSMVGRFDAAVMPLSFFAGVSVAMARPLNARLAKATNIRVSTFYSCLIGLAASVAVFFVLGRSEAFLAFDIAPNWYVFIGGILGAFVIALSNKIVFKVPALYLSLFLFLGQVFSGILIDTVISRYFSVQNLIGGIFVAIGLIVNLLFDKSPRLPASAKA